MATADTTRRVEEVVTPFLAEQGLEVIKVELKKDAQGQVLRVYIDSEEGVDLDTCAEASEIVSRELDRLDLIKRAYRLEVSSPGIDRPLTKPRHYQRFVGSRAQVKLARPKNGRRKFTGKILRVNFDSFTLEVDGEEVNIRYEEVSDAHLQVEVKFNERSKSK